ncbi:MAG: hypothetical protein M3O82_10535 [Verrucomicrobiota bacterium]|nr:hypothetical protein [Verrucomicrobiota bacterium]
MATPKEEYNAILAAAGVSDFASATEQINTWKANAGQASQWQSEISEIHALVGASDHAGAIAGIKGALTDSATAGSNVADLWTTLGAADQPSAIGAITTLRNENAGYKTRISELEASQADFNGRVESEVIKRASSAGLPAPIAKGGSASGESIAAAKSMTRTDFEATSPAERMRFIHAGGHLTDGQ